MRVVDGYDSYNLFKFSIPIGHYGDCFDRYLVRLDEMRESSYIILQCLFFLNIYSEGGVNSFIIDDDKIAPPSRALMKFSMSLLYIILSFLVRVLLFIRMKFILL